MNRIKLIFIILGTPCFVFSQNVANHVIEYKPAPGQHINIESVGTPQAAENMPTGISSIVSLGSFGGYIVLGFEDACLNAPENPYGIDFTIFGNSFEGSSEPGVVWVMKDENHNGKPDDTWYEIKGSQHFQSETKENYSVTYFKTETRDIFWKDNLGNTGILKANSYNTQEYYPTLEYFPDYPQDSVIFKGTLLAATIDSTNPLQFVVKLYDFGYADVHQRIQGINLTIPDNPYTSEIEGAGGDPIDISWAVDSKGNYVDLDSVQFVKIITGNLANIGWLGEISTDISYLVDVDENPEITGENELLVIYNHKTKLIIGETLPLEVNYFRNGKPLESSFSFSSQNTEVASVNSSGLITAENMGETEISVSSNGKTKATAITVVKPDSIEILSDFSSVYEGDTILLEANVYDNNGDKLNSEIQFDLISEGSGDIIKMGGKSYFVATQKGNVTLHFNVEEFVEKSTTFKVLSKNDLIDVYFTAKTDNENVFPLQKIKVEVSNLNGFIENRTNDYSSVTGYSLAHVLISGLQKVNTNFYFRDDENSDGKLYLYSVEKDDEFTYGWGGKTSSGAYAKAWIACLNSKQYLNNFDKIEVADGDIVILYHISDIVNPWNFTRMISDKDSASMNDDVEITIEKSICTFSEGVITGTALNPFQDQEIIASGTSYFSDENGKATVLIETSPPLTISSENDAVLISKKLITSSQIFVKSDIKIYPNPVEKELIVNGSNIIGKQVYIYDINGKYVESELIQNTNEYVDLQNIKSGMYILNIVGKSGVKTFKFVKK